VNGDVHAGESVLSANVRGLLLQGWGGGGGVINLPSASARNHNKDGQ
jgi:hypothetical protein